jgi:hypothetical protein
MQTIQTGVSKMKKLRSIDVELLSYLVRTLQILALIVVILGKPEPVRANDFFCSSGDVSCLIASINDANGLPGKHTINLEPGIYTLHVRDPNSTVGSGLPSIVGSITIQATADDPPTVIEADPSQSPGRILGIFEVSVGGELSLEGVTLERGAGFAGGAIFNRV